MRRTLAGTLVFLALPASGFAQNFDAIQIRTIPVTENIYVLQGSGGNIGVSIGEDGTFIVDDQFAPLTDKIVAAIAALSDDPVQFVVNSHWHYDHPVSAWAGDRRVGTRARRWKCVLRAEPKR